MKVFYQPGGAAYNPEWRDLSDLRDKEMIELRWVGAAGVQEILMAALKATPGQSPLAVQDVHEYTGRIAVSCASEIIERIGSQLQDRMNEMSRMVPKTDIQKLVASNERLSKTELDLRNLLQERDNQIESLDLQVREVEEKSAKLQARLEERAKEFSGLEHFAEQQKVKAHEEWKRVYDENVKLKKTMESNSTRPSNSDQLWQTLLEDSAKQTEKFQMQMSALQEFNEQLTSENRGLDDEVTRLVNELHYSGTRPAKEDSIASIGEEEEDENYQLDHLFPKLQKDFQQSKCTIYQLRWAGMCTRLLYRRKLRLVLQEGVDVTRYYRSEAKEKYEVKAMAENLKGKCAELEGIVEEQTSRLVMLEEKCEEAQEGLRKRCGEVSNYPEVQMLKMRLGHMENDLGQAKLDQQNLLREREQTKTIMGALSADVDKLGSFTSWLIMRILEVEATLKGVRIMWRDAEVKLLKACWQVLLRREFVKPPKAYLDMNAIASVLHKRGLEFFEGDKTEVHSNVGVRETDGLAELLVPRSPPKFMPARQSVVQRKSANSVRPPSRSNGVEPLPKVNFSAKMDQVRSNFLPNDRKNVLSDDLKLRRATTQDRTRFDTVPDERTLNSRGEATTIRLTESSISLATLRHMKSRRSSDIFRSSPSLSQIRERALSPNQLML
eukprot:CAMPEP_0196599148 /NCGR_PEP_ID=MMETSP1081-20130531/94705_1 /TAXON_ID=36882 /ORGANISM="Pyramimonas amylifera, Strain CCMP720" /LENGTH=665 /DNA_ID=CAMNT_0041924903 /DNA_START=210 /DNA_END=2207 /DNA_ORIENTATION=+